MNEPFMCYKEPKAHSKEKSMNIYEDLGYTRTPLIEPVVKSGDVFQSQSRVFPQRSGCSKLGRTAIKNIKERLNARDIKA